MEGNVRTTMLLLLFSFVTLTAADGPTDLSLDIGGGFNPGNMDEFDKQMGFGASTTEEMGIGLVLPEKQAPDIDLSSFAVATPDDGTAYEEVLDNETERSPLDAAKFVEVVPQPSTTSAPTATPTSFTEQASAAPSASTAPAATPTAAARDTPNVKLGAPLTNEEMSTLFTPEQLASLAEAAKQAKERGDPIDFYKVENPQALTAAGTTTEQNNDDGGMSTGSIVAVVSAGTALLGGVGGILTWFSTKKNDKQIRELSQTLAEQKEKVVVNETRKVVAKETEVTAKEAVVAQQKDAVESKKSTKAKKQKTKTAVAQQKANGLADTIKSDADALEALRAKFTALHDVDETSKKIIGDTFKEMDDAREAATKLSSEEQRKAAIDQAQKKAATAFFFMKSKKLETDNVTETLSKIADTKTWNRINLTKKHAPTDISQQAQQSVTMRRTKTKPK